MLHKNNIVRPPRVLEKLGQMTALRDTEALEHQLLKTLCGVLGVSYVSLYKTTRHHECVQALHHHRQTSVDINGLESVSEGVETVYTNVEMADDIAALMGNARLTGKSSAWNNGTDTLSVYPVLGIQNFCCYVVFRLDRELTDIDNAVLRGMLQVFGNYYQLLDESQRDRLTGLYNRHALEVNIERLWPLLNHTAPPPTVPPSTRRKPVDHSYWLAMVDIDHFKRINDTYGHIVGDEVLLLTSRLIANCFRMSDPMYRYGGEEFLVITSATDALAAHNAFERVRQTIEKHIFPQVGRLTISIGYALINTHYSAQEIIARADRSLYQAKHQGRNRCCSHEILQQQGVFNAPGLVAAE